MTEPLVLTPTDFVAISNQVLETSFGHCYIEGEISQFRISKQKWLYFNLKDEYSKVACFASIYAMPGPLQDGMIVRVGGSPKMHPQYGFSVTVQNIRAVGEGSIHQALALLKSKLSKEGLFLPERKRHIDGIPQKIALVASIESAAYADFIKIVNARWPFVKIEVFDTLVQGENAPQSLVSAIQKANTSEDLADLLVVTRGGGSADDLAAFNDERVVRAISASRIATVVAIGHEVDESLSELAADLRASTPSNAAELIVPDREAELASISAYKKHLASSALSAIVLEKQAIKLHNQRLKMSLKEMIESEKQNLKNLDKLLGSYNPQNVLSRGYAIVKSDGQVIKSVAEANQRTNFQILFKDGSINARKAE